MNINENILTKLDDELTTEIRLKQDYILEKLRVRLNQESYSFQRFNGLFGGKNNVYVDSVRTQFSDFNDFYSQWLKGLFDQYEKRSKFGSHPNHNARLLKDNDVEKFVRLFLERNFYRNLKARTRLKPNEQLWSIWFGYKVIFGLLIAPAFEESQWVIDKSEIRRADYEYWTIGHIFKVGLIDNALSKTFNIKNLEQFESTYLSVLKKLSNSNYEKEIYDRYVEYLHNSKDLESEPFLIPEVRYLGLEHKHKYRLDFTVLNPHTYQYTGFEISPSSSHMNVSGYREKQKDVNKELSEKWYQEMKKRNDYFESFEITIITFTEQMLEDFDSCWNIIKERLEARSEEKTSILDQMKRLSGI
jgi:hypothetical protein